MNENLDLFICTHKNFQSQTTSDVYKIVDNRIINVDLPCDSRFYSELYSYKYIRDNVPLKKYVGFCHYRRYFSFMDDIPDMDDIFNECDCVTSFPMTLDDGIREHYRTYHNIGDMEIMEDIIKEKFPDYYDTLEEWLDGTTFIPYNMFIMRSEDFKEYIDFVFGVLNEYVKRIGGDVNKWLEDNKEKYIKNIEYGGDLNYQYRIASFLGERLTNVFLYNKFTRVKAFPITLTDNNKI